MLDTVHKIAEIAESIAVTILSLVTTWSLLKRK